MKSCNIINYAHFFCHRFNTDCCMLLIIYFMLFASLYANFENKIISPTDDFTLWFHFDLKRLPRQIYPCSFITLFSAKGRQANLWVYATSMYSLANSSTYIGAQLSEGSGGYETGLRKRHARGQLVSLFMSLVWHGLCWNSGSLASEPGALTKGQRHTTERMINSG